MAQRGAPRRPASPTGCSFQLRDYREETGQYDRIVSVGMFEHVGVNHYGAFFAKLKALLAPDGVALLHSIGRMDGPGTTNPWLRKYIFPGGYVPGAVGGRCRSSSGCGCGSPTSRSCACIMPRRCARGARGSSDNRERIRALYDERFCRMWEIYLVGSEIVVPAARIMLVFQMQLAEGGRRRAADARLHARLGARAQRRRSARPRRLIRRTALSRCDGASRPRLSQPVDRIADAARQPSVLSCRRWKQTDSRVTPLREPDLSARRSRPPTPKPSRRCSAPS